MQDVDLKYKLDLTKKAYLDFSKVNFLSNKELIVKEFINAIVLPPRLDINPYNSLWGAGGVVDEKLKYVEISAQRADASLDNSVRHRVIGDYKIDSQSIPYIDCEVFYLNYFIKQWGHFLIDVIGRLWYFLQNNKMKIVYTVPFKSSDTIDGNYLEVLELLGFSTDNLIRINKPTRFKRVVVAEMSICACGYYTKEYKDIINLIKKNVGEHNKNNEKVYCTRRRLPNAKSSEIGEEVIESGFINGGFVPVSFEKMSVREQITLLNSVQEIVMPSGSLQHNLIFAPADLKVTLLMKSPKHVVLQHMVNEIFGGNVCSIDAFLSPLPVTSDGPFWYVANNRLKDYGDDHGLFFCEHFTSKFCKGELLIYYAMYIRINWKRIIRHDPFAECPYSRRELKEQYRKTMLGLD